MGFYDVPASTFRCQPLTRPSADRTSTYVTFALRLFGACVSLVDVFRDYEDDEGDAFCRFGWSLGFDALKI